MSCNRLYPDTDFSKINLYEASQYWDEDEKKAYDEYTSLLARMLIKYGPQLVNAEKYREPKAVNQ